MPLNPPPPPPQYNLRGAVVIEVFLPFRQNFVATLLFSQDDCSTQTPTTLSASSAWFFFWFFLNKFSPNLLNGRIDEDRAHSKQSL